MHFFFDRHVMRLVRDNNWVFEAAQIFAQDYALDCFRYLKLGGKEIYSTQKKLAEINERVNTLLEQFTLSDAVPEASKIHLAKASDFLSLVDTSKLDENSIKEAKRLYEEAIDNEDLQVQATLRAIRDNYETTLPRVMFVVRRAIKIMQDLEPKASDRNLTGNSEYLDWYEVNVDPSHPLYPVIGMLRSFYKVARNVASHHEGFSWDATNDQIILEDEQTKLNMHVHEFQQRYRYLVYLCEFGLRSILAAFCERERGEISDNLVRRYAKTFPEDSPAGVPGRVGFYVT